MASRDPPRQPGLARSSLAVAQRGHDPPALGRKGQLALEEGVDGRVEAEVVRGLSRALAALGERGDLVHELGLVSLQHSQLAEGRLRWVAFACLGGLHAEGELERRGRAAGVLVIWGRG